MYSIFIRLMLSLVIASLGCCAGNLCRAEQPIDFARDIQPILSENCFHCHGPDAANRAADLRLDQQAGAETMLTPGDREDSELFRRIAAADADELMPPPGSNRSLTAAQIELIGRWIDQGAAWGEHWAFAPLVRPELPAPQHTVEHPIDRFVLAMLNREGVEPSPPAPPEALLRRVSLDLTGLPPTPEELDAFLADPSPQAYARAVDRLLQSPAYGERMAWDWLDAARYADSNGYQGDGERTMWPWRDWVVEAFNRNLPLDQFTLWQIAGDLLPDATFEQKLATGFLRNHMINGEGGRIAEENRVEYVFDMTETVGTLWLGLTFNCCRCHDHKFDPLTQQDYYQLFAFFNQTPVDGGGGNPRTPPVLAVPDEDQQQQLDQLQSQLAEARQHLQQHGEQLQTELPQWEQATLARLDSVGHWRDLVPTKYSAQAQELTLLPDGSLLASGANPEQDTYRLSYSLPPSRLTGLRIEALRHESMTAGSLARSGSGNFVLTSVEVQLQRENLPPLPLKIASGKASFEQGGFGISGVWDDDPGSGWAVYAGQPITRNHEAVLIFAESIELDAGAELSVTLRHESPHRQHNLGRFRLSMTSDAEPALAGDDDRLLAALSLPADARSNEQQQLLVEHQRRDDGRYGELAKAVETIEQQLTAVRRSVPQVMIMGDRPERRKTYMLQVGLYSKPGEEVSADVPGFLPDLPAGATPDRLALAQWLIDDRNPLTARVTVNRFWQQLFGVGLVNTPEDFGIQGERPRYHALLDWLAADFRDNGWDVKALLRLIVTSRTYQQASGMSDASFERDPDNRLLARGPRRRLPAWMLRDQALAISGLLVPQIGGKPVNGYQPPGIWEEATFGQKKYVQDHGSALHRRTLYTFWRRIVAPTMLFDNAPRQVCSVSPRLTNTPLHALTTLNETTYVESARALAQRVLETHPEERERIVSAFRLATARVPREAEIAILQSRLAILRDQFASDPGSAERLLAIGQSPRNEALDPLEHAAWTALSSLILNLDEAITKP